jgi:hypothetical protein
MPRIIVVRVALKLCATLGLAGALGCVTADDLTGTGGDAAARRAPRLSAPLRIAPQTVDDVAPQFVNLRWSAVAGAEMYAIYLGVDPNPPLVATQRESSLLVRDLPECTTHYWRVVAMSADDAVSSVTWSFETACR